TEPDGTVVLTISNHLEWNDEHLMLLQEKLNSYLSFIESGEINETYPAAKDSRIKINVICKYAPTPEAASFLSKCKDLIAKLGYKFGYEVGI
ncbi:MAG: DUF6572 domain-containing protein, partial [Thiogranum sp.]